MLKRMISILAISTVVAVAGACVFAAVSPAAPAAASPAAAAPAAAKTPPQTDEKSKDLVALYVKSPLAQVNGVGTTIDEDAAITPVVENDRALVPLRFVAESFGADVAWDDETKTVAVREGVKTVKLTAGKPEIDVDGKKAPIDAPVKIINDRTFVPFRALAEAFGKQVFYDRGLIIISADTVFDAETDKEFITGLINELNNLPVVGSAEKFEELAREHMSEEDTLTGSGIMFKSAADGGVVNDIALEEALVAAPAPREAMAESDADGAASDYSQTNTQVEGVDEADVIKTDGKYIYYVNGAKIQVVRAAPPENMEIEFTAVYDDVNFTPNEIFIDGDYMVAIGSSSAQTDVYEDAAPDGAEASKKLAVSPMIYPMWETYAHVMVYNIADKSNVTLDRTLDISGGYISSRRIGDYVYIVTSRNYYSLFRGGDTFAVPQYKDSAVSLDFIDADYGDMRYFPKDRADGVMTVVGFNVKNADEAAKISTFVGGGDQIYVSPQSLYVTTTSYGRAQTTHIYKFALGAGEATYQYGADVSGSPLNQFSMDESDGFFRISTTEYNDAGIESNNLFILTPTLDPAGKITGIAEGERIYSTRFMGDRAYMVTFKLTDPLFTIDVSDPYNPKILGELKIPGYSDYLHPYDDTHVIGFGKDTVEMDGQAYYKGMKLSLFDVSDVTAPKELFTEYIGGRGTNSELLYNHKALMFDKNRGLMAFPVEFYAPTLDDYSLSTGDFTFQGAYVYTVDLEKGFGQKGRVTHIEPGVENLYSGYEYFIHRAVMIGGTLYTVSGGKIVATDVAAMAQIGEVSLK